MAAFSETQSVVRNENISSTILLAARRKVCFDCASTGSQKAPCLKGIEKKAIVSMADNEEDCALKTSAS